MVSKGGNVGKSVYLFHLGNNAKEGADLVESFLREQHFEPVEEDNNTYYRLSNPATKISKNFACKFTGTDLKVEAWLHGEDFGDLDLDLGQRDMANVSVPIIEYRDLLTDLFKELGKLCEAYTMVKDKSNPQEETFKQKSNFINKMILRIGVPLALVLIAIITLLIVKPWGGEEIDYSNVDGSEAGGIEVSSSILKEDPDAGYRYVESAISDSGIDIFEGAYDESGNLNADMVIEKLDKVIEASDNVDADRQLAFDLEKIQIYIMAKNPDKAFDMLNAINEEDLSPAHAEMYYNNMYNCYMVSGNEEGAKNYLEKPRTLIVFYNTGDDSVEEEE